MLERLYEIQGILVDALPEDGTPLYEALMLVDALVDELESKL